MAWNPLSRFGRDEPAAPAEEAQYLVAGRECGGCTACCKEPLIEELKKPSGTLCQHCDEGAGCRIYDSRPQVCRDYLCAWRRMDVLDDAWRPDRCGIMIAFTNDDVPPAYANTMGIRFEFFRDARTTVNWQPFVGYVTELIRNGMPVVLQVAGPPGFEAGRIFLNDLLITSVALRDYGRVILDLTRAVALCENVEKKQPLPG